jgi:carboxylesterase
MKGGKPIFINKNSDIGILMIHGFTSTPDEFKELAIHLAEKGFSVSAPLVAGHGTTPQDLMKTTPQDWINSVRESYLKLKEISKNVLIIGNSFGSNLAIQLTRETKNEPMAIITLGAPIFLKHHKFILSRLYSYGFFVKYYSKPPRLYRTDFIDMLDEVTYPKIPIKSLRYFLGFIKKQTKPNLEDIKIPALVVHSDTDPVVNPKSATYIYEHLGSDFKRIYWFRSKFHTATADENKSELFNKIIDFIKEVQNNQNKNNQFQNV